MLKKLRILIAEDNPADYDLAMRVLNRSELKFEHKWVDNKTDFVEALNSFKPEIVLSDHSLPTFSSVQALELTKEYCNNCVFILITGTVSEEFAVQILKSGADDYILKSTLIRLPSAIVNAYQKKLAERERENNYKKLQEANHELKTFIYRASHDLRGPICSLRGLMSIAKNESELHELMKMINFMDDSASRLDSILIDLIETIELKDKLVLKETIDFDKMIQEILDDYRQLPKFDQLQFLIRIDSSPQFCTDRGILKSLLKNVLENSIKYHNYSRDYSFINISITKEDDGVAISIKDNGTGIKQSMNNRVFEMFFRGSSLVEGSGLGLYLTKVAVEKLKGKIEVISEENSGTAVEIFIPSAESEQMSEEQFSIN